MMDPHPIIKVLDEDSVALAGCRSGFIDGWTYATSGHVLVVWPGERNDIPQNGDLVNVLRVIRPMPDYAACVDLVALLAWCGGPPKTTPCVECDGSGIDDTWSSSREFFCRTCGGSDIWGRCPHCNKGRVEESFRAGLIEANDRTANVDQLLLGPALSTLPTVPARLALFPYTESRRESYLAIYAEVWQLYLSPRLGESEGQPFRVGTR